MKGVGAAAALAAAGVTLWCGEAEAYRPFDGTDAAVVETGETEIELGPVEYLRVGAERTLLAPDLRINYGSPGPVSRPNSAFSCRGSMINMGPEQSLTASSRSAGTGAPST